MLNIVVCILVFMAGFNLRNWFSNFSNYDKKILLWLFLWHAAVGLGFVFYLDASGGGDAFEYWDISHNGNWNTITETFKTDSATGFIYLLNYFPSKILNLSFFAGSMLYMLVGYAALVFIYKIIKENIPHYLLLKKIRILRIPIFPYFLFLPNINFWTSGVGKDTIVFFSIVIFIYALKNINRRFGYLILSIILSVFLRPHILLFLLMAVGISIMFDTRIQVYKKVFLSVILVPIFLGFLPYVMNFANIENLNTTTIETYANKKAGALSTKEGVGSAIDISNYSYPLKVFTFLFRPFFIDMPTLLGIAASFENLLSLLFFIKVFRRKFFAGFLQGSIITKTLVIFSIIGTLVFPLILGNLGIILREKTPFTVAFIIFGYWSIMNFYSIKTNKQNSYYKPLLQNTSVSIERD